MALRAGRWTPTRSVSYRNGGDRAQGDSPRLRRTGSRTTTGPSQVRPHPRLRGEGLRGQPSPHPLVGGFTGDYEPAVVVWNGSDPATAIRYVSHDLALRAVLVNPDSNTSTHNDLVESATYVKRIWKATSGRAGYPRPSPTPTASSPRQLRGSHATGCRYAG